jgi:hypothetical protein
MKAFKLENEPKIKTGFKTPDHYFDDLSAKILQQINEKEVKVIPIYKRKKVLSLMAAAAIVIAPYDSCSKQLQCNIKKS